jgi:hypothetical protein
MNYDGTGYIGKAFAGVKLITPYVSAFPSVGCVMICIEEKEIIGHYATKLEAYRARRVWRAALQHEFLLWPEEFKIIVTKQRSAGYITTLTGNSAVYRYALYRVSDEQRIGTIFADAHLPKPTAKKRRPAVGLWPQRRSSVSSAYAVASSRSHGSGSTSTSSGLL